MTVDQRIAMREQIAAARRLEKIGGVAIFFKFFQKEWSTVGVQQVSKETFPDLKSCDIYFAKVNSSSAEFFVKNDKRDALQGSIAVSTDGIFYKFDELTNNPDGELS
jgi:hypothetical protein